VNEALASFRTALELDPKLALAHANLGLALKDKGQADAALACCRTALELDPKLALAHANLGWALYSKGQVNEALASFRTALELDPKHARAHGGLGAIFCDVKRDYDAALASFRTALELDPKDAWAHYNLGNALGRKGQGDEAITSYRRALELDPNHAECHCNLGAILCDYKRDYDAAIACFRTAIALAPKLVPPHNNLGEALTAKGQVDEAIACFRTALELDPKLAEAQTGLAKAQRLAAVQDKLPAFLNGDFQPTTNDERLALSEWCQIKKRYRTAARLYADAHAADPKLAADPKVGRRYYAACSAALAAAGQGEDAAQLDDKEKARLRKQALDWLRADLALRTKQLESGPPAERTAAQQALQHWQQDRDLAGLRDNDALAKLPAEERGACETLWADVAALLKKADAKAAQEQQLAEAGKLAQRGLGLLQQQQWAEAEPVIRQSLAIRQKMQPDVWTTFNTQSLLGGALLGQHKYAEAEPLLRAGYEGMKKQQAKIPPPGQPRLAEAVERLVHLYEALGKQDEVARWTKEREALKAEEKAK
jgi:tetratricopeptide (TPR) repeat protein